MPLHYDLYWSFRSPYSYFVMQRLVELERDYDVACNVRVVYPIAVRQPEFFDNNDPLWVQYFMCDIFRCAQYFGLPFAWPNPGSGGDREPFFGQDRFDQMKWCMAQKGLANR